MRFITLASTAIVLLAGVPAIVVAQRDPIAVGYAEQGLNVIEAWDIDMSRYDARRIAIEAIQQGDFRFIGTIIFRRPPLQPQGLTCRLDEIPYNNYLKAYFITDVIGSDEQNRKSKAAAKHAELYNETIASAAGYTDTDVCFPGQVTDKPRVDDGTINAAVRMRNIGLVRERLRSGRTAYEEDRWGMTALSWALELGEQEIVSVLMFYEDKE